ncbi:SIMPL domain-containing protein [Bacillus tuaregi]|uniref:SIMPL domain-containing protein n=1 Tax=Bacillus tuaregi TaxID=1816695 RepID=UPI0008F8E82C|nr:SIMPL domain-containing protein [Bacillus tuaregi]
MHFPQGFQYHQPRSYNRSYYPFTMIIEGEGKLKAKPDQAIITLGVVTENSDVQIAQDENTSISNSVIQKLLQLGIDDNEIRTTIYSVNPRYDYIEGKTILRGYEVEHQFEVTVKDLKSIGIIYDTAIKNGINRSGMLQFIISQQDALYRRALKKAVQNAKEKADEIAKAIGASLSPMPIKITEQRIQAIRPFPTFSAEAASVTKSEAPPIQSGQYTIDAIVKIVYAYQG